MLDETDEQVLAATGGRPATHAVVPVGCGSIAQAVTQHFKSAAREKDRVPTALVVGVEPETAACLKLSLETGFMSQVTTAESIMCGMNCGTLSTTAWPTLHDGVDAAVVVSEVEAHRAVLELEELGIHVGPCGAATLGGLKRICAMERERLGLSSDSVVVLHCTEGSREYEVPVECVGGEERRVGIERIHNEAVCKFGKFHASGKRLELSSYSLADCVLVVLCHQHLSQTGRTLNRKRKT